MIKITLFSSKFEKINLDSDLNSKFKSIDEEKFENLKTLIQNPTKTLSENKQITNRSFSKSLPKVSPLKPKTSNKENKATEVSTQTTFIETRPESKSRRDSLTSSAIKRERIQALLNLQRQQHERRLEALEKLSRLERLQAEKLKYLMLNGSNDSILLDSFFQSNNNKTYLNSDGSIDIDLVEEDLRKEEEESFQIVNRQRIRKQSLNPNLFRMNVPHVRRHSQQETSHLLNESEFVNQCKTSSTGFSSTKCQVIQLKDTTVRENPDGFKVVKEKLGNTEEKQAKIVKKLNQSWFLPIESNDGRQIKSSSSEPFLKVS